VGGEPKKARLKHNKSKNINGQTKRGGGEIRQPRGEIPASVKEELKKGVRLYAILVPPDYKETERKQNEKKANHQEKKST